MGSVRELWDFGDKTVDAVVAGAFLLREALVCGLLDHRYRCGLGRGSFGALLWVREILLARMCSSNITRACCLFDAIG